MRCPRCGESWDLDSIHEEVSVRHPDKPWMDDNKSADAPYQHSDGRYHNQKRYETYFHEVLADFRKRGCVAIGGDQCTVTASKSDRELIGVIFDSLGDDVDAIAAFTEDAEQMGLFE